MAERIPAQLKEEIVAASDIVDVVSKYVALKRTGSTMVGLCPFHKEKTPSFHVTPDRQLFHCFGCSASGDVIEFVRRIENLDFVDAVKFLADRANISIDVNRFSKEDSENYRKKQLYLEINKETARFFRDTLFSPGGKDMLAYIVGRGLTRETILTYGLGCAPKEWDSLIKHLAKKGYSKNDILSAGVAIYSDKGRMYDRFRDRLMFPIFDIRGNVLGFGGRYIDDRKPKYLNSPETSLFNKRLNLFSLNIAKNFAEGELILVEGYMDVISLYQNNVKNAVASLGTAFTAEQARLVSRYAGSVVICYDTDEAGIKATERAIEVFKGLDVKLKILSLPSGKDPDEFVKKNGGEIFRELAKKADTVAGYRILNLKKKYDISNAMQKVDFLSEAAKVLSGVQSSIERETFVSRLAEETGVSSEAINAEISKLYRKSKNREKYNIPKSENTRVQRGAVSEQNVSVPPAASALVRAEQLLLSLCALDRGICKKYKDINAELFTIPLHKKIIEYLLADSEADPAVILTKFGEEEAGAAAAALAQPLNFENNITATADIIERIKKERLDFLIKKAAEEGNAEMLSNLIAEKNKREEGLLSG